MKIFCTTISLILGLYFLRNNLVLSIIISLIYLVFIFYRFNKKYAFFLLAIFISGAILGNLNLEYNNSENTYQGMVVEVKRNYFIFQSHFEKYYVYEENTTKEIGDFLTISSTPQDLKFTNYESQFDFQSYLKDKGVKRSLKFTSYHIDFSNPIRLHTKKEEILSRLDENARGIVNALLFNEKDTSNQIVGNFEQLNLIYLISLSGIYLHFLFASTTYVFGLFTSEKVSEAVPLLLFSPLALFSFPRVSILRIFLINIMKYINKNFLNKRFSYLTLLSILALFFVIIDYHLVYQQSFYIGFSLSLLSIFFRRSIKVFPRKRHKYLLAVFPYLFLLPIMSITKNQLHLLSLLHQIILTPMLFVMLLFSMLLPLKIPIYGMVNSYGNFLVGITKTLLKLDISLPIALNEWFVFIYYAFLVIIIYLLESQRIVHARNVAFTQVTMLVISLMPVGFYRNAVYFINVGQGDSILIQNRTKTVLIDTGGNSQFDMATETLIPFFHKIGVNHIDLLVTTHDDFDHAGAAYSLVENFNVKKYYHLRSDFPCQVGDIYLNNINQYDGDENDSSLVFLIDFMSKKWLLTGDASIASENYIISSGIDIDCDILKVGHHGSKTSTSEAFIKATTPMEAIISCGATNKYGHPNKEVVDRLTKHGVKIHRTDLEGTISYVSIFT